MTELNPLLKKILADNQDTDCGKRFGFANFQSLEDFEEHVPLTDYNFYFPLIELTTRIGEKGVFVSGPLAGYTLSASAIGKNKEFPCTQAHIAEYGKLFDALNVPGTTFLMLESMPKKTKFADGMYLDSILGIAYREAQKGFLKKEFLTKKCTSPQELIVTDEVIDSLHVRLLFALTDAKVEQIIAPYMWGIWEICTYLESSGKLLLNDLEKGEIAPSVTLPDDLRAALNRKLKITPERLDALRRILGSDDRNGLLKKIWPGLKRVTAMYSGGMEIYKEDILPYLGYAEICNGPLLMPEGIVGKAVPGTDSYELFTKNVYAEFRSLETDAVVRAENAQPGSSYEIIVTNQSGLYRFRTGDVVTIVSNDGGKCLFTYSYRLSSAVCVGGSDVTLNARQIQTAVLRLKKETGVNITDYCYYAGEDENGLEVFVEGGNEGAGAIMALALKQCAPYLDKYLGEAEPMYAKALSAGEIAPCRLEVLQPQTQLLFRDMVKMKKRTAPDYIKPVRKIKTIEQDRFFRSQVIS